ncbi:hypothetical protein FVEN_g2965 [Fusarium venenatum]|uniref:GST N-terminal domain-containing protein n=1 Tax=Fusarium venenatum TaxID=56646 RepID=A0A2L2TQQ7_9HYPO|nr:uncharacterized protein FVRRES_06351 [Fusarium venenatum]KAG8359220.1 hypothetical protein FVEN_g2965 [Fusarium venenatum]KAH6993352.1 hypothetical protein EDB82DRAFT_555580 [Fusarium venenatum]CEI61915.1 unnamed protein product [Fusarium venenatum]
MDPPLTLFVLSWGVYPRRVLIYLAEKNILNSPLIKTIEATVDNGKLSAPGKPSGTAPMLRLPGETFIKQSIAIIEYFEEICHHPEEPWQVELAKQANGTMLGESAAERSRVRDMLSLADEITSQFSFACHKGTALFQQFEQPHPLTAKLILEYCRKNLRVLNKYYEHDPRFDCASDARVNIADCVLYSVLRYAKDLYSMDLLAECDLSGLQAFYDWFGKRKSVQVDDDHFPGWIKELASQWLPVE